MVLSELQINYNIRQYLTKINFEELDHLVYNLYEYLKHELYGIEPSYLIHCDEEHFRIPKHFKWILKEIKGLIEQDLN
jgi:hypothetical protein